MKKLLLIIFTFVLALGSSAQEPQSTGGMTFENGTFNEILAKVAKNKKGPKLIFMDCFTTWCGPCKMMSANIFPMKEVGDFMNANFVNTKFDMEKGEGIELAKKYAIKAYPTFLILDDKGNEVNRILGSSDAASFIAKVKKAMNPANSPKAKKAEYEADKNAQTAVNYMSALEDAYLTADLKIFAKEYFAGLKPSEKYTPKNWYYISMLIDDPDSDSYSDFLKEKSVADNYLSKQYVDKTIVNLLKNYTFKFVTGRLKNIDTISTLSKINSIDFLMHNDATATYCVKIANLYSKKQFDDIAALLNLNELMRLNMMEKSQIEQIITSIKGISPQKVSDYFKAKSEMLAKQAEESKTISEKFLK